MKEGSSGMRMQLVKIGNSRGLRLPKAIIDQVGLDQDVELEAHKGRLVIRPAAHPRAGWGERFQEMARHDDDRLLDPATPSLSSWDEAEWEW